VPTPPPRRNARRGADLLVPFLVTCAVAVLAACPGGGTGGAARDAPESADGARPAAPSQAEQEGFRLLRQGDPKAAEPHLVEALKGRPDDARLLEALAFVYGRTDRWRQAEDLYRRVLAATPGSPGARIGLARVLSDTGRDAEGLAVLRAASAPAPGATPAAAGEAARILVRLGRPAEAAAEARTAMTGDARNPEPRYVLGTALEAQGDLEGALAAFQEAIALDPGHVGALAHVAAIDSRLGRAAEAARARDAHDAALARHRIDDRVRGHRVAGVEAFNRQDYTKALEEFRAILREDPRDPQAHLYEGSALLALGRRGEARQALQQSLAIDPRNERTFLELGRLEALDDHLDQALDAWRRAIAINPDFAEPHYFIAGVLQARGDADGARSERERYETLRRLTPESALQIADPGGKTP
jgi:tetratricopeptide (TPR) repeat protein